MFKYKLIQATNPKSFTDLIEEAEREGYYIFHQMIATTVTHPSYSNELNTYFVLMRKEI